MHPDRQRNRFRRSTKNESDVPLGEQLGQLGDLFSYTKPYRWWLVAAIVGVTFASALGLVFPLIMGGLVDTAIGEDGTNEALNRLALLLLGVFLAQAVFNYLRS